MLLFYSRSFLSKGLSYKINGPFYGRWELIVVDSLLAYLNVWWLVDDLFDYFIVNIINY